MKIEVFPIVKWPLMAFIAVQLLPLAAFANSTGSSAYLGEVSGERGAYSSLSSDSAADMAEDAIRENLKTKCEALATKSEGSSSVEVFVSYPSWKSIVYSGPNPLDTHEDIEAARKGMHYSSTVRLVGNCFKKLPSHYGCWIKRQNVKTGGVLGVGKKDSVVYELYSNQYFFFDGRVSVPGARGAVVGDMVSRENNREVVGSFDTSAEAREELDDRVRRGMCTAVPGSYYTP